MNILVTGANGFVGKNLIAELKNHDYTNIFEYTKESTLDDLSQYTKKCDFVFHLAGVNRPKDESEFMEGNFGLTSKLLQALKENDNQAPVLITSSIQADLNNPYGKSKKAGEDILFDYQKEAGTEVYVYRLPNLFGKWSKPNYNSVVATFCHNIARNQEIQVNDSNVELELAYIDDVLAEFMRALDGKPTTNEEYCVVPTTHNITLGQLAKMIISFKESRDNLHIPDMGNELTKKLYSTYLSYLPEDNFSYPLTMHVDERGSFTEFMRTENSGQVSVNISKPGITKGNHWHHTKNEKFLVVSGEGMIRFRLLESDEIIEYKVSGDKLEVVDIPVGYTHSIVNTGNTDMVTLMWVNENFDPKNPDTYFMEV